MIALAFTEEESIKANRDWGANCGPHALAASAHLTLEAARSALVGFDHKLYTNPSMMENALNLLGIEWKRERGLQLRAYPGPGIARVQWEGRWLNPGVPKVAAYQYTHWIALNGGNVLCTVFDSAGWHPFPVWSAFVRRFCEERNYLGWHITSTYKLTFE